LTVADATAATGRHPAIVRLCRDFGIPEVGSDDVDVFLAAERDAVLFFTEDPKKYPESSDVAAVLPELIAAFPGRFRCAVIARESERALQRRFGFARWPALVFLRNGDAVGSITGIRDWSDFLEKIRALLESPTRRELAAAAARENAMAGQQEPT
jgi:hydrogenase-1 operon protein HyaE